MPETDLDTLMAQKRDQLIKQRDEAQAVLNEVTNKLRGIEGYYAAMKPVKAPNPDGQTRKPRETGKRVEVLQLVQEFPDGATTSELQDKLGIKGDKKAVQSLSNALSALKKAGQVTRENGAYRAT